MLSALLVLSVAALLGLVFGSFLNVCVVRLPAGMSVVQPRSRCNDCGGAVSAIDNIPVLGFIFLRGRCRACGAAIRLQYPLVEIATAAWFVVSALPLVTVLRGDSPFEAVLATGAHAAATAALGFLLIGLGVMDWQTHLLPNEFTLGGLALGTIAAFTESFFVPAVPYKTLFTPEEVLLAGRIGAALVGYALFWSIGTLYRMLRHREGMGGGDAKLAAMLGIFLGPGPLCAALFVGITFAAIAAGYLIVARRATGTTRLPLGSFLSAGGLLAAVWGDRIALWYRHLFL